MPEIKLFLLASKNKEKGILKYLLMDFTQNILEDIHNLYSRSFLNIGKTSLPKSLKGGDMQNFMILEGMISENYISTQTVIISFSL